MPPACLWGTGTPLTQMSRRVGELLCLSHATRGCISPILCPAGDLGAVLGRGGSGEGACSRLVSPSSRPCVSCAWICAWSQDVWVLSEQLTLASATSLCLTFPPLPLRRGLDGGRGLGFAPGPKRQSQPWPQASGAVTRRVPGHGEEAFQHPSLVLCPLARPSSRGGAWSTQDLSLSAVTAALRC